MSTINLLGPERPNSWTRFKENIASLISLALLFLRQRTDLVRNEKELNRVLYICLGEANYLFDLPMPAYDGQNPPHPADKQKAKREDNRPDMYWTLTDHTANYQDWHRTFVLECKRLGLKTSETWILTEQYVIEGILRFFIEEKGYGKGCETGAMVGYVQDMEFDSILTEVNSNISKHKPSIPLLTVPTSGWQLQVVNYLTHTFQRPYIPTTFFLQHFWVDMRDCCFLPFPDDTEDFSSEQQALISGKKKQRPHDRAETQREDTCEKSPIKSRCRLIKSRKIHNVESENKLAKRLSSRLHL